MQPHASKPGKEQHAAAADPDCAAAGAAAAHPSAPVKTAGTSAADAAAATAFVRLQQMHAAAASAQDGEAAAASGPQFIWVPHSEDADDEFYDSAGVFRKRGTWYVASSAVDEAGDESYDGEYTDDGSEDDSDCDSDDDSVWDSDDEDAGEPDGQAIGWEVDGLLGVRVELAPDVLRMLQQPRTFRTASGVVYGFWQKCPLG